MAQRRRSGIESLASREAFVDLSFWRKIAVSGSEALIWLNSLVSADLSDVAPGRARFSLLLSPTGKIRAAFTVTTIDNGLLLIQDPQQPRSIDELLAPYTLSSDVSLKDRTEEFALFAFPRLAEAPVVPGASSAPSCLGAGVDLLAPAGDHDRLLRSLGNHFAQAGDEAIEMWRVTAGIPRFGVDVFEDDLPQEAGLAAAVSFEKGCYLGQEAVAKVQHLGHPRRLLLHLRAHGPVSPGDPVLVDGAEVGEVTGVATDANGSFVLARVKWDARRGPYSTPAGAELSATDIR